MNLAWFTAQIRASCLAFAIVAACLLPGLIGHDPWKQDEAYTFGVVLNILETGHWVVPTLAGEPFMEKPPLYYLAAAATSKALSPFLPAHDGARVASLIFMAIGLAFSALAARHLFGPGRGRRAALLLVACPSLVSHAHEMITDTALFAGFAIAFYGMARALDRPRLAGALLGTGVGIGFMSKGLVEPAMVGLAALLLPIAFRTWRRRAYLSTLAWAAAFAAPWLLAWPIGLLHAHPREFVAWFWTNNLGRYFGFARVGAGDEPWFYTTTIPWFTFPAGPIALWAAWRLANNRGWATSQGLQLSLAMSVAIVAVLSTAATSRSIYLMPLLIPVAVLAATAVDEVPRKVAMAATGAMALLTAAFITWVWVIWGSGVASGLAPRVEALAGILPADFRFDFEPALVAGALLVTALWVAVALSRRPGTTPLQRWTASIAAVWGVPMTLLLPWIDHAKSFRDPFLELSRHHAAPGCVASAGLGEPQRAMLHYVAGIKTARLEVGGAPCEYLLVQLSNEDAAARLPSGSWSLVWQGSRPGELRERFLLYRLATESRNVAAR